MGTTKKVKKTNKSVKSTEKKSDVLLNSDLYRIHGGLVACQGFKGRHFAYMLASNGRRLEHQIKKLDDSIDVSDDLKEYREKFSDLKTEHNVSNNNPVSEKYEKDNKALQEKYKEAIDKYNDDRQEMLDEEVSVTNEKFYLDKVKMNHLPEEITGGLLADIFECIEYDEK